MAAAAKVLLSVLDYLDVDGFAGLTALLCHPGFGALAELSQRKLAELDSLMDGIKAVRRLLKKMMQNCRR